MSNKPTHELLGTVGEYMSQGEKRKRHVKCGTLFCNDKGEPAFIKLETVPVVPEWSGFFSLKPIEKKRDLPDHPAPVVHRAPEINAEDDIPF